MIHRCATYDSQCVDVRTERALASHINKRRMELLVYNLFLEPTQGFHNPFAAVTVAKTVFPCPWSSQHVDTSRDDILRAVARKNTSPAFNCFGTLRRKAGNDARHLKD